MDRNEVLNATKQEVIFTQCISPIYRPVSVPWQADLVPLTRLAAGDIFFAICYVLLHVCNTRAKVQSFGPQKVLGNCVAGETRVNNISHHVLMMLMNPFLLCITKKIQEDILTLLVCWMKRFSVVASSSFDLLLRLLPSAD